MDILLYLLWLAGAYLSGSLPFGYWLVRIWKKTDVRKYGSGNIGATNVVRVAGPAAAAIVLFLDIAKGFLPVHLAKIFFPTSTVFLILLGIAAILGHSWSIFLAGRGGKGVATSFGVMIALFPKPAAAAFLVWCLVALATRYVSVASLVGALTLPFFIYYYQRDWILVIFGIVVFLLIGCRHRENLKRLYRGTENRFKMPWSNR